MSTPIGRDPLGTDVVSRDPVGRDTMLEPDVSTHGSTAIGNEPMPPADDRSLGELVALATSDMSTLIRKEVQLAKVEIKHEAVAAGKGAGALAAAAFAGIFALLFLSVALAYALGEIVPLGTGFLIVGLLYLIVAAVAALIAKKNLSKVGPPEKTIETVKDDIAFAKNPTSSGTPARR